MGKHKKWFVVKDSAASEGSEENYTISLDPKREGWETDSGAVGYGLPKEVAEWIVDVLNSTRGDCGYYMDKWGFWHKRVL